MNLFVIGQPCHIRTGGSVFDTSRPCVVLIHGAASDGDVWQKTARALTCTGYSVLVPDLPGHGLSGGQALGSIEILADWVIALLDAAWIDNAFLVGHSMGALIVLEATARYAPRVRRLALLGSAIPMSVSAALIEAAANNPDLAYRLMTKFSHTPQFYLTGSGGQGVWGPGITLAILRRSPQGVLATDLGNCNRYMNGLKAASLVDCPTLLVVALRDRMTPRRNVEALQLALRHVTRAEIANCGHAMMNEQPERIGTALVNFLATEREGASEPVQQQPAG
jgi:pimeloyl-ACP methyl ester carboxylesterase